jgi:SAM-dependent methyltransferase
MIVERATKDHFGRISLRDEHFHRYGLAARVARGSVVDCACGIGYGSEIIDSVESVKSYLGIDPSGESIEYARKNYAGGRVYFECGTLEENSCVSSSIDTFLMFETLEHTETPAVALANVRRCLKPNGVLIGSVPSAEYEALCESTYGPNPFHLQRFTRENITEILGEHFESVRIFSMEFVLGSLVHCVGDQATSGAEIAPLATGGEVGIFGSIVFIAGSADGVVEAINKVGALNKFLPSIPKVILDRDEVVPIRVAMQSMEVMIRQRDEAIAGQARMLEERWAAMQSMEGLIRQRDEAIAGQARMLEERWAAMQSMEGLIRQRDEAIAGQRQVNDSQSALLRIATNKVSGKSLMDKLSYGNAVRVPFRDLGFSLYLFVERLHAASLTNGAQDLFFFAREGKLLKEMFDFYQALKGDGRIRTHYLRVSRRSTFLMSLGTLDEENFDVLFRQYRRISIVDFLRSLDLEKYAPELANEMGVVENLFSIVRENLPSDGLFLHLLRLPGFNNVYETERVSRANAFERYLGGFLQSDILPDVLHVVDVGWKGSIQDNLYNWLRRRQGSQAQIEGSYVGLIATGAMSNNNRKTGLLFSNINGRTRGFHIFNENRSLYEIILHADHGSARSYFFDIDGVPRVVEDQFSESEMIAEKVHPVSLSVMQLFQQIAVLKHVTVRSDSDLFDLIVKKHSRMVFQPSDQEIDWIFGVSHVENFGVFEESTFGTPNKVNTYLNRAKFTWAMLCRRRPSELGFWPWLTLRTRGLPGLSSIYIIVRRWQRL